MKPLNLFMLAAILAAGCDKAPSDSATSKDSATASLSTDSSDEIFPEEGQPIESVSIDVDRAGIISLGMTVDEVFQWFDSTQVRPSEGAKPGSIRTQSYTIYSPDAAPLMAFTVSPTDTITAIIIQNPAYQTEKGIGVGSTFSQLSRAYHISKIFTTSDKHVMATVEELQKKQLVNGEETTLTIRFELGVDISGLLQENNTVLPSSVPPDTQITKILL